MMNQSIWVCSKPAPVRNASVCVTLYTEMGITSGRTRKGTALRRWDGADKPPIDSRRGSLPISNGSWITLWAFLLLLLLARGSFKSAICSPKSLVLSRLYLATLWSIRLAVRDSFSIRGRAEVTLEYSLPELLLFVLMIFLQNDQWFLSLDMQSPNEFAAKPPNVSKSPCLMSFRSCEFWYEQSLTVEALIWWACGCYSAGLIKPSMKYELVIGHQ